MKYYIVITFILLSLLLAVIIYAQIPESPSSDNYILAAFTFDSAGGVSNSTNVEGLGCGGQISNAETATSTSFSLEGGFIIAADISLVTFSECWMLYE